MRKISGSRVVAVGALALAILSINAVTAPAEAHRSRVVFGFGTYFGPSYYYPPPYYYYPPPVYYAPSPQAPTCRDYRGDATIDANGQPFYGRACLQPDGKWHIVR